MKKTLSAVAASSVVLTGAAVVMPTAAQAKVNTYENRYYTAKFGRLPRNIPGDGGAMMGGVNGGIDYLRKLPKTRGYHFQQTYGASKWWTGGPRGNEFWMKKLSNRRIVLVVDYGEAVWVLRKR